MNKDINLSIDKKYEKILEIVKQELSCSAHDIDHIFRVCNLGMSIAKSEKQVDMDVLVPAILLHDIARVKEDRDATGSTNHAVLGSEMAGSILRGLGYEESTIKEIKHCIISHRYRSNSKPKTIEAKILFDADKVDGMGAIGIARTFMMSAQYGSKLYDDMSQYKGMESNLAESNEPKNRLKHPPNIEFEIKFKKIPESLYTKKAKEIAEERRKYMESFFERLGEEVKGLR
ncbi:HD domain-containing protein [Wukongibacter baidiensis]|uniref:HD domain-containing protein n=1 Tax=Wukongibacter baidiensis TaxID=1723361 RepID=UPI003D7F7194